MRSISTWLPVAICGVVINFASADNIRGINMDFVTIGNARNPGDTRTGTDEYGYPIANPYGCGAVGYNYRIGMYEITNSQWNAFVAAAGVPTGNTSSAYITNAYYTDPQQPMNHVSWYATLQFCNYLTSGDKSKGVYQFSGNKVNPGDFIGIDRAAAQAEYGTIYVIPTEDEWYKAAYYKPDDSGYSLYANGTSTPLIAGVQSNYNWAIGSPWNVGSGTMEQNGTFDMMGNVYEWNEALISDSYRGCRGGSFGSGLSEYSASSYRNYSYPSDDEFIGIGFRVASIPEPASALLIGAGLFFARLRRRRS
jgi:formylglycine-generating enzyme